MCNRAVHFHSSLPPPSNHPGHQHAIDVFRSKEPRPSFDAESTKLIESVWEAVLEEQVDQWAAGESDPERMADIYRQYTALSQVKAIVCGLKSQEEAGLCIDVKAAKIMSLSLKL